MELSSKYNPTEIEQKWYKYWLENKFFHSEPNEKEPFTIVIPPPNVTGVLHMGHMLNNTIQDVLVRRARMQGKNACWVPGTDHASIATEAKVVAKLAAEGIKKTDLTREEFLTHAWEWTHKHGGIILEQLKKLGCSCDWDRTAFTMDEVRSESVLKVFVDLYNKGLIYRGVRMVNWDPSAQTALSDEEVIFKEQQGKLYYLRYKISPPQPPKGGEEVPTDSLCKFQTARNSSYNLLKTNAEQLRKFSTEAESALWEMLRAKKMGVKFNRQHIIDEYIVDFVCLDKYIVIEVDGGYHNDSEIRQHDEMRTTVLNSLGFAVLRFTNEEVLCNTDNVFEKINYAVQHPPLGGAGGGCCIVATTRPETIFGDTAMCINPNDPKNQHLKGKKVIVPIVNREIPVIEDDYVDIEFGTGCLKVTPAHDVNDYMLGEKYGLETLDIFNADGTLNQYGLHYEGKDRFIVRKEIEKELEEAGLLEKVETYTNKVGSSERTGAVIEPKLSMQWFLKMEDLAKPALDAVEDDTIKFYPEKFKNTYRHWMTNIKDWCISRQLWWGHQIPAWYISPLNPPQGDLRESIPANAFVVAENEEEARKLAIAKFPPLGEIKGGFLLRQDEDCLDTWFSSWLWPISVFDGINNPDNEEINYYYPTNDLVTGPDIIFFWVARMIMSGYEFRGKECFRNVYFTGIVRDKIGRKMSKQLGNSPDPIELMNKYGADGVRMGMLLSAPAGNDIHFDEALCEQGRNFCNKIWNAFRLIKGWEREIKDTPQENFIAINWFGGLLRKTNIELEDLFSKYRLSEALMLIYKLFWDEFSAWYLEIIKPEFGKSIDARTYQYTMCFFENLLQFLHPFMPFITEELYHAMEERAENESIMFSQLPDFNVPEEINFEIAKEIITNIRNIRASKNISPKEKLTLQITATQEEIDKMFFTGSDYDEVGTDRVIMKLANIEEIKMVTEKSVGAVSFLVGTTEYAVPVGNLINADEEIDKAEKEIQRLEGFLKSVQAKLSNEKFIANAKPEVVENERKKLADAESKIKSLEEGIANLRR